MKKTLSKVLAVIIAVMLILSACPIAFAADGDIASGTAGEGITWVIDVSGTLTISGEGAIVVDWYAPPWENYNDSILNIVVEEGITEIPSTAFCYAENLKTVSIPASVTDMDEDSTTIFWACYALEAINVDPDNQTFVSVDGIVFSKDKTKLCFYPANKEGDTYTIPSTVTHITIDAFRSNRTLQSVVIPDTVISIGDSAFADADVESVTIGNGIKTIPNDCFQYCSYIKNITIPDSVETIENSAFWSCSDLKNIIIGSGVKTIGFDIFNYCDALTVVHYNGTADTWDEIIIDENNEKLNSLPMHYTSDIEYKEEPIEATCTTDGHTAGDYCNICADYVTGEVTETALGHDYVDGVCQREDCGYICEHVNEVFDDKCDECGVEIELEFSEISVEETKTAYIEESHKNVYVKFVPEESGQYVLYSDNGGDDDNIDPFACVYDSEFDEIDYDDDDGAGYNFELIFDADKGETYYFALSAYDSDVEYSYTLDKYIDIAHQPTSAEPYVDITWDKDATYQWYTVDTTEIAITDQNADVVTYDWGESSYNAENGWSGVPYEEGYYGYDFFTVSLEAGETVTVELIGDYTDGVGLYDYNTDNGPWLDATDATIYELTADEAGDYTFYTFSDSGDLTVNAYLGEFQYTEIDGQNTNTLDGGVIGENYVCMVALEDSVLVSDVLNYTYAITHQPTEQEPYVNVNDPKAKYKWQSIIIENKEITDQDEVITEVETTVLATYDTENGWSGMRVSEEGIAYFIAEFSEDDTITVTANDAATGVGILDINSAMSEEPTAEVAIFDETGTATLTVPADGMYIIVVVSTTDTAIKVIAPNYVCKPIENKTDAKFTTQENGSYVCEVTFADGSTQMSDIINKRYSDVQFGQWYSNAVEYVSENGIMTGYGGTNLFGTADNIQRQDFVVILARIAGVDLSVYDDVEITFKDVADNTYFTNAILWAADVGITTGYAGGTEFGVGDKITREQLVTFLYRYATYVNGGVAPEVTADAAENAAAYPDYNGVTDYAKEAVIWALDNGIIKGQGGTHIAPGGNALRCEVAQIMYNIFLNDIF